MLDLRRELVGVTHMILTFGETSEGQGLDPRDCLKRATFGLLRLRTALFFRMFLMRINPIVLF